MDIQEQAKKAELLRQLHKGPKILVLPNAWDAASARILEDSGFQAIATTSAGVAGSLGYPDGQRISREEMADAVRRIVRAVSAPVTADMEAGYGSTEEASAATARASASFCNQLMVASRRRRFSCVASSTACAAERAARSQASLSASRCVLARAG